MFALPAAFSQAQQPPKEPETSGARELFFGSSPAQVAPKATPKATSKAPTKTSSSKVPVKQVSTPSSSGGSPLALRYSVLKVVGPDKLKVSPKTAFRSGDGVLLSVQSNSNGYLYLVHQGTSGNWDLMYPTPGSKEGANRVEPGRDYLLPPKGLMRFSGDPGVEKLFLVLSRQPHTSLDSLIFELRQRSSPQAPSQPIRKSSEQLLAQNRPIDNSVIDGLRTSISRDLVFESVDAPVTPPSDTRDARLEPAVYVANTNRKVDSVVVVDINLVHK